jgi:hypothetical protein
MWRQNSPGITATVSRKFWRTSFQGTVYFVFFHSNTVQLKIPALEIARKVAAETKQNSPDRSGLFLF